MSEPSEIITNIPTEMALRQAEISATRMLTGAVERLTMRMDDFGKDLHEINTKVTRIEARDFDGQIAKFETEITARVLRVETDLRTDLERIYKTNSLRDDRINANKNNITRLTTFLMIGGSIGGIAFGASFPIVIMVLMHGTK